MEPADAPPSEDTSSAPLTASGAEGETAVPPLASPHQSPKSPKSLLPKPGGGLPKRPLWKRLLAREVLRKTLLTLGVLLCIAFACYIQLSRHFTPGVLPPEALDRVQAAREFGRTRKFSTMIIRPLLTSTVIPNRDGTMPDLSNQPLFSALAGTAIRLRKQTGFMQGDREAVLVTIGCFAASLGACYLLSRRLFGMRGAVLALVLYGMGSTALSEIVVPQPVFLGVTLFTLLLITLFALDVIPSTGEPERRPKLAWAAAAGALFGLLYLTLYSSLALLPAILFHVWRSTRRRFVPLLVFSIAALLVTGPILLRTFRLTRNPIYNARTLELMMHTETYPDTGLYRQTALPQTMAQYLATGGIREVGRKFGNNLLNYYREIPGILGLFVTPLFLAASLTRFADGRINRLRGTVYFAAAVHILGLSLFQPYHQNLSLLLLYAPAAAVYGAAFLLSVVRARNLPIFFARTTVTSWAVLASVPGLVILWATPTPKETHSLISEYMNERSPQMVEIRTLPPEQQGMIASDVPWDIAYRCEQPTVWLPADSGSWAILEERAGQPIRAVTLTADLATNYANDVDATAWITVFDRITSLLRTAANLDASTRQAVIQQTRLFYPERLLSVMREFRPVPVPDRREGTIALVFWRAAGTDATAP
jgi:hypothetical protein